MAFNTDTAGTAHAAVSPSAAASPQPWRAAAVTDVGLVRAQNEDAAWVDEDLALVADGLGGHAAGEVASRVTVETVAAALLAVDRSERTSAHVIDAVRLAHQRVLDLGAALPELVGMGTTITGLVRLGDRIAVVNVGDSRTYQVTGGHLTQLTRDDSLVADLVDAGTISADFAPHHPQHHVITAAVGLRDPAGAPLRVTVLDLGTDVSGRFVVCSDGLSDPVDVEGLHGEADAAAAEHRDALDACEALVRLALKAGGPDNVTVAVVDIP